jgi:hypothetical protein
MGFNGISTERQRSLVAFATIVTDMATNVKEVAVDGYVHFQQSGKIEPLGEPAAMSGSLL